MIRLAVAFGLIFLAGCSTVPASYSPGRPLAPGAFSHQLFDRVLQAHVRDAEVDYPAILADRWFVQYLDDLDRVDPNSLSKDEQLAFWINVYNAYAIKGILDGYSPGTWVGRYRYFIGRTYRVGGASINLYDLERDILIAQFHEPRIHFAIVCASSSCPKLQARIYGGTELNRQLEQGAREFINDPSRNRFDRANRVAYLSKIFDWFTEDFEAQAGSLQQYVARYVSDPVLTQELATVPYRIEFLDYDWSLNGPAPRR
ncbi:MAG: DUF547 domain-containing protein [Nitrospira sp.]|nr:DUF547 domain-containing protein [Nitrospira sp.]